MYYQNRDTIQYFQTKGYYYAKREKAQEIKVNDINYDFISFEQLVWDFIDTPHFQRLRKIKQLGCLEYVYPSATHTRFEHCLGTAYLAQTFMEILMENNPMQYEKMSQKQKKSAIRIVVFAALMQELGQGPFSRAFDNGVVKSWDILEVSIQIFQQMLELGSLKGRISIQQKQRIIALMKGMTQKEKQTSTEQRKWQFQIVNNKLNSIDVDKFDYCRRDALHLGAKDIYVDHQLIFNQARIIDDEICYPTKIAQTITNVFHSRYKLYKIYYFDVTNKAIERMVTDILNEIKRIYKFQEIKQEIFQSKDTPDSFLKLNDNIIECAEFRYNQIKDDQEYKNTQQQKELSRAMELLRRIRSRELYKFVKELKIDIKAESEKQAIQDLLRYTYFGQQKGVSEQKRKTLENHFQLKICKIWDAILLKKQTHKQQKIPTNEEKLSTEEEKKKEEKEVKVKINPEDIFVTISDVGLGMKDQNPLLNVGFFIKNESSSNPSKIPNEQIKKLSMLFTNTYKQKSIKFFIKRNDEKLSIAVNEAIKVIYQQLTQYDLLKQKISVGKIAETPGTNRQQKSHEHSAEPLDIPKQESSQ